MYCKCVFVEQSVRLYNNIIILRCMRCYKRLLRFGKIKSNLRSVQEEIKEDYKKGAVRTKRLRRDCSETD